MRGSTPKRRSVRTVFDWSVDVVADLVGWLTTQAPVHGRQVHTRRLRLLDQIESDVFEIRSS